MKIKEAKVSHFRNIQAFEGPLHSRLNLFFGENGQGKTNFLEALYVTLRGRSFRPYAAKTDWLSAPQMKVELHLQTDQLYESSAELRFEGNKWSFWHNQKKSHVKKLSETIPIVAFSPDDHSLIRGGPELRRQYLDEVFSDSCPGYLETLSRYESSLKNRNQLLRKIKTESSLPFYERELDIWTRQFAKEARELSTLRKELWPLFETQFHKLSVELFENSTLGPLSINPLFEKPTTGFLESDWYLFIKGYLNVDLATGWTHRGPHRDDFSIYFGKFALEARHNASQGQARLLALLLKWTHAEWVCRERAENPLFLVDDFSSELDSVHRRILMERLFSSQGQIFLTGTESNIINSSSLFRYSCYRVQNGVISIEN